MSLEARKIFESATLNTNRCRHRSCDLKGIDCRPKSGKSMINYCYAVRRRGVSGEGRRGERNQSTWSRVTCDIDRVCWCRLRSIYYRLISIYLWHFCACGLKNDHTEMRLSLSQTNDYCSGRTLCLRSPALISIPLFDTEFVVKDVKHNITLPTRINMPFFVPATHLTIQLHISSGAGPSSAVAFGPRCAGAVCVWN